MHARWPQGGEVDDLLIREAKYLTDVSHEFRVRMKKMSERKGKVRVMHHHAMVPPDICVGLCIRITVGPVCISLGPQ